MMFPIGSDNILLNLDRNRQDLATSTSRLASGLRIQTAADDPSGLAISENLRSRISGLQQSVENVQTGGNALRVADGAAATIQQILQRIDALIVESNSDINSDTQLKAIQAEIDQGLLEINRIAQNANFNGLKLFDGSHDTYVANPNANVTVTQINPGLNPDGTQPSSSNASNPTPGFSPALLSNLNEIPNGKFVNTLFIMQIIGYSPNPTDPVLGPLGAPGDFIREVLYSNNPAYGNGQESVFTTTNLTSQGYDNGTPGSQANQNLPSGTQSVNFDYQNMESTDVGVAIGFSLTAPRASGGGTAININDGGQEGSVISISLPTLNTNALQVSGISVLRPTQVDDQNFATLNQATGVDQSNQYAAMDAQIRVNAALDQISTLRATVGSQMVATQEDANNDNVTTVNLQATESSIRDLNIGTATTQFTREQILNQVGTSVLAQSEVSARQLTALLIGALVA